MAAHEFWRFFRRGLTRSNLVFDLNQYGDGLDIIDMMDLSRDMSYVNRHVFERDSIVGVVLNTHHDDVKAYISHAEQTILGGSALTHRGGPGFFSSFVHSVCLF